MKTKDMIYNLTCQQERYGLANQMSEQSPQKSYEIAREDFDRGQRELREINKRLFLEKFNGKFIGL